MALDAASPSRRHGASCVVNGCWMSAPPGAAWESLIVDSSGTTPVVLEGLLSTRVKASRFSLSGSSLPEASAQTDFSRDDGSPVRG